MPTPKKAKKKVAKTRPAAPKGSLFMEVPVHPEKKAMLDMTLKDIRTRYGCDIGIYTLMDALITQENLNLAENELRPKCEEITRLQAEVAAAKKRLEDTFLTMGVNQD